MSNKKSFLNIDTNKIIEFDAEEINKVNEPDAAGVFGVFLTDVNCIMCKNVPAEPTQTETTQGEGNQSEGDENPPAPTDSVIDAPEPTQDATPANNPMLSNIAV